MMIEIRVTRPDGDVAAFEFRRPTIRVGAGSMCDLLVRSAEDVVQALTIEVSPSGFRIKDVNPSAHVHVRTPTRGGSDENEDIEEDRIYPVGTCILVGKENPTRIEVESIHRRDDIAWRALGVWRNLSDDEAAREQSDHAAQLLALAYRIATESDGQRFVDEVDRVVRGLMPAIEGFSLGVAASSTDSWALGPIHATGVALARIQATGLVQTGLLETLSNQQPVWVTESGSAYLLLPMVTDERLTALVGLDFAASVAPETYTGALRTLWNGLLPLMRGFVVRATMNAIHRAVLEENRYFRERQRRHYLFKELVTESVSMKRLHRELGALVSRDTPVLLYGEAGTGKELLARALHHLGGRASGLMVSQHCAVADEDANDVTLFGFSESRDGARVSARRGALELADGGTVFLDEVHALSTRLQTKLLRVIKEGELFRIGDAYSRAVNVRICAATHVDLMALADEGKFRRDLALALTRDVLHVPALRDRREDISPLVRTFVRGFARRYRKALRDVDTPTLDWLVKLRWPGNVRELQTVIERAVLQANDAEEVLHREHFAIR